MLPHQDEGQPTIRGDRRRLLAAGAALALGAPVPARAAGQWTKTPASDISDVSMVPAGHRAWLTGRNGTVWWTEDGTTFTQVPGDGMKRIAAERDLNVFWTVGFNGTLWKCDHGRWIQTKGTGMADVAVGIDGMIWLTGLNGAVWFTSGSGQSFGQARGGEGFARVATDKFRNVLFVGSNGTLWFFDPSQTRWSQTKAQGMLDVSLNGPDSRIWLTGRNGTVWWTLDGDRFTQIEASGFESISAQNEGSVWAVGTNGTLWRWKG
ncbi:MAG: hypothetical protein ACOYOH_22635 [Paracraurococcus sp.]